MHTLGISHEQSRVDRNTYVTVIEANINPTMLSQFDQNDASQVTNFDIPYAYGSIMHYGQSVSLL